MSNVYKLDFVRKPAKTFKLPITDNWECQRSGDCCREPASITMTREEAELLMGEARVREFRGQPVELQWVTHPEDPRFVLLKTGPCPFLVDSVDGKASCSVYSIRPYNCRRWGCFRPDVSEQLRWDGGPLGAPNLRIRFEQSRTVRRALQLMQRKAQKWAIRHGWTNKETEDGRTENGSNQD